MPRESTLTRRRNYIARGSHDVMEVIKNAMKIENVSHERLAAACKMSLRTLMSRKANPEDLRLCEIITAMEVAGIDEILIKLR